MIPGREKSMARELPLEKIKRLAGTEVYLSDWVKIGQDKVDLFAAATGDRQR
jgi:acyl dehydratase